MKKALISISGRTNSGPVIGIELAKALVQNGYEVYAIVSKDTLNINDWINEKSLQCVYLLKTYTSISNLLPLSIKFQFIEKRKLKKKFKEIQFDYAFKPIFHLWSDGIIDQVSAKKVITICHDPIMHSGESWIKHILYKRHIKKSDDIIVLTKSFIPLVCEIYNFAPENVHYMPHGLMRLYKEKQNKSLPCIYDENYINYVFFGRIQKYKGIEVLLEAYNILRAKYLNVTLTIVGKGRIEGIELVSNKEKGINVVNQYIPDDEVGRYFDGSNVVIVLPYLDATQSGVIPIAIEYGTPIIASDTGGLREQMLNGEFGIFTRAGDAKDVAEKMELFIKNPMEFRRQQCVMEFAMTKLEWKEVVKNLLVEIQN